STNGTVFVSSPTFAGAGAGTYTVAVQDANGCTATKSLTISEPAVLVADASATPIPCNGGASTITGKATGGTSPYQYSTNGTVFVSSPTFAGAGAGTYTVAVQDANGCTATKSLTISEPAVLVADASATPIPCNGGTSTITVSAPGGASPYQYSTNGTVFVSSPTFAGAGAGTYTVAVQDANGCTATKSLTISEPAVLVADASATPIPCNGGTSTITV